MKFRINKEYFHKAISEVSKAVSTKTPFPILSGIKLIAKNDSITLIGCNSDIIIEKMIPNIIDGVKILDVYKPGSSVISATYLSEIVKKLPNEIDLEVNEKQIVSIQSDEIITKLSEFNSEEYPKLPMFNKSNRVSISSHELIEMINQTVFAASKNETRPVLTGVNFSFQQGELSCVATNSHRLALRILRIESEAIGSYNVPNTSLIEVTKLFGGGTTTIEIFLTESYIVFKSNYTTLYSRLIKGNYPNITGLFPKEFKTTVTIDTKQFLKGIDRACLFAKEWKNNNVNIEIKDGSKIRIFSSSTEIGKLEETQSIKTIRGEKELSISLDGSFLMDALKVIKEEEVSLAFSGSMRPILIQPIGNNDQLHLISPVRSY